MEDLNFELSLSHEVNIITRNYSPMRLCNHKWLLSHNESFEVKQFLIEYKEVSDEQIIIISDPKKHSVDVYKRSHILRRLQVKRNEYLFKAIYSFWTLINPFRLRAISKQIYINTSEFIYRDAIAPVQSEKLSKKYALQDAEIDFGPNHGLTFTEFYDSFFNCLDNLTKSALASEYSRMTKAIHADILNASFFKTIRLNSKLHLTEPHRQCYSIWMEPYLKAVVSFKDKRASTSAQNLLSKDLTSHFSPTLLTRTAMKNTRTHGDLLLRKIENMTKTYDSDYFKIKIRSPRSRPIQSTAGDGEKRIKKIKKEPKKLDVLNKTNPLSTEIVKSGWKGSTIIEGVIQGRKVLLKDIANKEIAL
ncbi:unnamed protein product [Blepharisma stoltei]|uniref:Uncharacterized protein n=1 Tax=Blepharisma stoltei TaxID=1481888 RepID=A0AAU9K7B6_9CILI|nr:unnamed protein product [Blepharisma stoltei]